MYAIRDASADDLETLVAFTLSEAREAESFEADVEAVRRGVSAGFGADAPSRYWVVEHEGRVVGSTSVVKEWSDFRGGNYWWIQSLYVAPEHRGAGASELLMTHVARLARAEGALDVRLYVHQSNTRAIQAYARLGFVQAPYLIMKRSV